MKKSTLLFLLACPFASANAQSWTATWATAPMNTVDNNRPPVELTNHSIRQIIHVSCGGDSIRLKLTNEYSDAPVTIKSVFVADALDSCDINKKTARFLSFAKKPGTTIEGGQAVWSDAVAYKLKPLQRLSITINYADVPKQLTSHPGSRTTSYIIEGEAKAKTPFGVSARTDHWFNLSALDVHTTVPGIETIGIIGNSITDGRGSTTNHQDRWTDRFSEAMGENVGVLNLGIGGNCVVPYGGLGDPAVKRYDRDILSQTGVKTVIIFEGINDIGGSRYDPQRNWVKTAEQTVHALKEAYKELTEKAHAKGMKVYLATITACKGHDYYTPFHEVARQEVNNWIRTQTIADGVIDFDQLTRDPQDPERLLKKYSDDWLHLNAAGYAAMGKYAAEVVKK